MPQPAHLEQGLKTWRKAQRKAALDRVAAYKRWLKSGSDVRRIPVVPTNGDYVLWRAAGRN